MTDTPDKEWIERALIWFDVRGINHTPADVLSLARELQSSFDQGVERGRMKREPTEAQLIAARDWSYAKYGQPIGNDAARGCWQAMFDALTPTPTEGERG